MTDPEFEGLFKRERELAAAKRKAVRAQDREKHHGVAFVAAMLKKLDAADVEYDGVAGSPPEWLPDPLKFELKAVRQKLLFGPQFPVDSPLWVRVLWVRRGIRALRAIHGITHRLSVDTKSISETGASPIARRVYGLPIVNPGVSRDLEALIYIRDLANLGQRAGLRAYLGRGPAEVVRGVFQSEQNRDFAKKRRPNEVSKAIDAALERNPGAGWAQIHELLEPELVKNITARQFEQRVYRAKKKRSLAG